MELVDGMSLSPVVRIPRPVDQVLHVGEQIARALAAAHARGIIHCDIKPEKPDDPAGRVRQVLDSVWLGTWHRSLLVHSQPPALSATCRPNNRAVKRHHPQAIFSRWVSFFMSWLLATSIR